MKLIIIHKKEKSKKVVDKFRQKKFLYFIQKYDNIKM